MAELHEIIGGVLRDIAQSRIASDIHSREASLSYQKDPILRKFPVPRVDIASAEIDLRFAVASVERDDEFDGDITSQYQKVKRLQLLSRVFERFSAELSEALADEYYKTLKEEISALTLEDDSLYKKIFETWQVSQSRINTRPFRDALADTINDEFTEFVQEKITKDFILSDEDETKSNFQLLKAIAEQLSKELDNNLLALLDKKNKDTLFAALNKIIKQKYKEMRNTIVWLSQDNMGVNIEVDVASERLETKTPELVSSIKLKVDIRNYVWTQTEERDGKVVRQLVPE